jgi:predicted TIM-barrel fold metal-dependent hydrolase
VYRILKTGQEAMSESIGDRRLSNWIDTHLHLIFPDQLHYDWIAAHPLQRAFTLEEYRVEARALGIARSVYVEADVRESDIERETEIIGVLADRTNGALAAVVSSCRSSPPVFIW